MTTKEFQLKQLFFAQYWGQKYKINNQAIFNVNQRSFPLSDINEDKLMLKFLSSLSDEDYSLYIDFCHALGKEMYYNHLVVQSKIELAKWRVEKCFEQLSISESDWLRSKGYALPFMQYSVNDLVSMGFVELLS